MKTDSRTRFLISFTNIYFSFLACVYLLLALYGYMARDSYNGISIILISLFTFGALVATFLSKTRYAHIAFLYIPVTTITLCTYAGIAWGFDLPSVLLMYIVMLIFVSLVTNTRNSFLFLGIIILSITIGFITRSQLGIINTWKYTDFRIDDILEFSILFLYAVSLILFSNREQQKLLTRSLRSEHALKLERDNLSETVEERTREIKQMQMEHIAHMYRFVEFGKVSAGLFHDLMSPLQSLKLKLEQVPGIDTVKQSYERLEKLLLGARQQIRISDTKETFSISEDIQTICDMIRHITIRENITIRIHTPTVDQIYTNRTILNHVLYNLITNACEAMHETEIKNLDITIHTTNQQSFSIQIKDSGVGIKPEDIENIFDPFYSTKQKTNSNCGLGLSSARFCTEKYLGGKLLCESIPAHGTVMKIIV